jgi:phosphatidylserine/phosphatidylglycerophosphate/cardiolipin synthase-like enzyme
VTDVIGDTVLSGVLRLDEDRIFIISGNVRAELKGLSAETLAGVAKLQGRKIQIAGRHTPGVVEQARIVEQETSISSSWEQVFSAIELLRPRVTAEPNIVSFRPGYLRMQGRITDEPAVVVVVSPIISERERENVKNRIRLLTDVPVDVAPADPRDIHRTEVDPVTAWRAVHSPGPVLESTEAAKKIGYKPPPKNKLRLAKCEVRDILCHIGPDSGWSTLQPFLAQAEARLTIAMFELTAPHIADTLIELGENNALELALILQENTNESDTISDLRSAWEDRFTYAKAVVSGPHRIFANSYHTKVAVRDGLSTWLSSGNWSPHSQPVVPDDNSLTLYRLGNREWHVIIEDQKLAEMFEGFIRWDLEQAAKVADQEEAQPLLPDLLIPERFFLEMEAGVLQPKRFQSARFTRTANEAAIAIQPLMTPDNYSAAILELIDSARQTLFMQYSYVRKPADKDAYLDLVRAVSRKMRKGIDVRVIVDRRNEKEEDIDEVLSLGWQRKHWRRQKSAVHNKGIIVDGHTTVVGSQNWSGDGTQANRDASLVIEANDVAAYYSEVFNWDWTNLTIPIDGEPEIVPLIAEPGMPTPIGMVRVPWHAWYDE